MTHRQINRIGVAFVVAALFSPLPLCAAPGESKRLERAKDLIADEQWARAIDELKAAVLDPNETSKDEALFWLAQSQSETRDAGGAIETISRLEQAYPKSAWVKPARLLRLEVAKRLQRNDFLWFTAAPPPMPAPAPDAPPAPPGLPALAAPPPPRILRLPPGRPTPPAPPSGAVAPSPPPPPAAPPAPTPPAMWAPPDYLPDTDLRIQALSSLIRTDAAKVIPMLKTIALESRNAGEARRAMFVLGQSKRPDARSTVVEIAKTGPEAVRLAAVRELGRSGGATVADDLLQVYSTANDRVKMQVVTLLGQRDATTALVRIAQSETNRYLRNTAIVTLAESGGLNQLATLYERVPASVKRPIMTSLFAAQADVELIRIAEAERDPVVRREVLSLLRRLATPRALQYLEHADKNR